MENNRLLDIGGGLAIYKVHIDRLREQELNARVMDLHRFELLTETIRQDKRLESLPLCSFTETSRDEFQVISGHHRIRAARKADIQEIFVIVDEQTLTKDEVRAKQLAHNSINGRDDAEKLKEIYASIEDMNQRLRSGVMEEDLRKSLEAMKTDELKLLLDFELLNIVFLKNQKEEFEDCLALIKAKEGANILVAEFPVFDKFKKAARKVAHVENIRNASAILYKMVKIVKEHYARLEAEQALNTPTNEPKTDQIGA